MHTPVFFCEARVCDSRFMKAIGISYLNHFETNSLIYNFFQCLLDLIVEIPNKIECSIFQRKSGRPSGLRKKLNAQNV